MEEQQVVLLFRYVLSIALGAFGLWPIVVNWCVLILDLAHKKSASMIPLVGGIILCIAIAILPNNPYPWLCSLAFVIDPGGLFHIVTLCNEKVSEDLGFYISNGCSFRTKHMSWSDFCADFFGKENCYAFVCKRMLIMISGDPDIGYIYVIESDQAVESKSFSSRQELFDNLKVNGMPMQEIWEELK